MEGLSDDLKVKRQNELSLIIHGFGKSFYENQRRRLQLKVESHKLIVDEYDTILRHGFKTISKEGTYINEAKIASGMEMASLCVSPIKEESSYLALNWNVALSFQIGLQMLLCCKFENNLNEKLSSLSKRTKKQLDEAFYEHLQSLKYIPRENVRNTPILTNANWWGMVYLMVNNDSNNH